MLELGKQHQLAVDTTENDSAFYEDNLKKYHAVVFFNTTGDVLNPEQQNHLERWVQAGVTEKITFTTMPFNRGSEPLQASGLLGPVRVVEMR
jgi:hypothetical protein